MIKDMIGQNVPQFSLPNQEGETVNIGDQLGRPLVIYFYPKDDTPGCTAEACGFRDQYEDFVSAGATVFGISTDSVDSHKKFRERYRLPFDLLSDAEGKVAKMFGIPSGLFGFLRSRSTYIVNQEGVVVHAFSSQLNFKKHISESLKAINEMQNRVEDQA